MAPTSRLSVPTTAALPHTHTFPSSSPSVVRTLAKLSRPSLLSLAITWITSRDQNLCAPFLVGGNREQDDEGMYPAAQSLDELHEIYQEYQQRKGGRKEVVDRILEGDWRHGITLYQLAMADMRSLLDHPTSQRWAALKLVSIKAAPLQEHNNSVNATVNASGAPEVPRFHAPTFLRNLQRELAPIVKAHYYLKRAETLPLTLLRLQTYDSPYSSQRALQDRSINVSQRSTGTCKTIWVAFPDGTPAVYISLATTVGPVIGGEARSLRKVILDALPKAFSKPHERYSLQTTSLSARSLPALLSLRGPGRSNAAAGGWSIFADGTVEGNALDLALVKPAALSSRPSSNEDKENEVNLKASVQTVKRRQAMIAGPEEVDDGAIKRRRLIAAGRFGTSGLEDDGKGIDRLDIRIDDPFSRPAAGNGGQTAIEIGSSDEDATNRGANRREAVQKRRDKQPRGASVDDLGSDNGEAAWLPSIQLTFHGTHVFAGIRKMVEEGIIDGESMPGWMTGEAGVNVGVVKHGRVMGNKGSGL